MKSMAQQPVRRMASQRAQRAGRAGRGFTLVELILVLVLLSLIFGMAAPSLRGFGRGSRMRNAAETLAATARWARSQAIIQGTAYRLEINGSGQPYTVSRQDGQNFATVVPPRGQPKELSDGMTIQLLSAEGENFQSYFAAGISGQSAAQGSGGSTQAIYFLPTGRTDPAMIRLSGTDGTKVDVVCPTAAENYHVIMSRENAQ